MSIILNLKPERIQIFLTWIPDWEHESDADGFAPDVTCATCEELLAVFDGGHQGIELTEQEAADLAAYLDTLGDCNPAPSRGRRGDR